MSYCRFGSDSDIYLYSSTYRDGSAVWVLMYGRQSGVCTEEITSRKGVYDRLLTLRTQGLVIPDRALDRLQHEMTEAIV